MGSQALPALHLDSTQAPDLMSQYGNLLKLQSQRQGLQQQQAIAPLQQQQAQQSVQSGQLQLQQQQQAQKDQQATTAAMDEWDGKSYDDLAHLALKNGASGSAAMGIQQKALQQKTQAATLALTDAKTGQASVETQLKKNDLISGALSPLVDPKQTPDAQLPQAVVQTAQQLQQQGLLDPQHVQMAQQLAQSGDPNKIRQGVDAMRKGMMANSQILAEAKTRADIQEKQGKLDPNSPLYSPSPASVAMGTAPGAAQIQAGDVKQAAAKAAAEESARMPGEMALQRQRQTLMQGDPNAAGQLLVDGDATLSELKTRGANPQFIDQALQAAHRLSGGKYNAQQADAAFSVAKSPANVAFFGSAKSLTDQGGTLDQLANAGKAIPGGLIPKFNSIADWEKAASGSGPIAKYASLALGVADDYSKVMGGGQGSDTSRLQALQLVGAKQSPSQRADSIEGIRGAVGSQIHGRIGSNPILQRMYGDSSASTNPGSVGSSAPIATTTKADGVYEMNGKHYRVESGKVYAQ